MGCDIHLYREKFTNGRWESLDKWTTDEEEGSRVAYADSIYVGRNYDFFGLLAKGVRREFDPSFAPRGMPLQCDPRISACTEGWGSDAHNHSYLYLHELRELQEWAKASTLPVSGMMDTAQWEALQASIASGKANWDLLYPYCAWTTSKEAVEFNVQVPVDFNIGESLKPIVDSFDGADGINHRIVFWFDN